MDEEKFKTKHAKFRKSLSGFLSVEKSSFLYIHLGGSMQIKPGITADGFRTAVRDYTEPTVVEELGANSYDADAINDIKTIRSEVGHEAFKLCKKKQFPFRY